jgi:hypothetical protein
MNRALFGWTCAINAKIGAVFPMVRQAAATSGLQVGGESPTVSAVVGLLALGKNNK